MLSWRWRSEVHDDRRGEDQHDHVADVPVAHQLQAERAHGDRGEEDHRDREDQGDEEPPAHVALHGRRHGRVRHVVVHAGALRRRLAVRVPGGGVRHLVLHAIAAGAARDGGHLSPVGELGRARAAGIARAAIAERAYALAERALVDRGRVALDPQPGRPVVQAGRAHAGEGGDRGLDGLRAADADEALDVEEGGRGWMRLHYPELLSSGEAAMSAAASGGRRG
jgi:hypothetical protein